MEGIRRKDINSKPLLEMQRSNKRTPTTFRLMDFFFFFFFAVTLLRTFCLVLLLCWRLLLGTQLGWARLQELSKTRTAEADQCLGSKLHSKEQRHCSERVIMEISDFTLCIWHKCVALNKSFSQLCGTQGTREASPERNSWVFCFLLHLYEENSS